MASENAALPHGAPAALGRVPGGIRGLEGYLTPLRARDSPGESWIEVPASCFIQSLYDFGGSCSTPGNTVCPQSCRASAGSEAAAYEAGLGKRIRGGITSAVSYLHSCASIEADPDELMSPALADGLVLESVIVALGSKALFGSFLPVCRQWFSSAVCHPCSFREPAEAWCAQACLRLDEQLEKMHEPPEDWRTGDLRIGLVHAEEELGLTELAASFPSGITVAILRYARKLGGLLHWVNMAAPVQASLQGCANFTTAKATREAQLRQACLKDEVLEFRRRVVLLVDAMSDLRIRLPDPDMPMRWAMWFEEVGEVAGLPLKHRAGYRTQREQVAAVWANNRRTFLCTDEHVDLLLQSLGELDMLAEDEEELASQGSKYASLIRTLGSPLQCLRPS